MRALLESQEISAQPGVPFSLSVQVSNTADVIDSVYASIDGLEGASVSCAPRELPLFPGTSGPITVTVHLPSAFRAGRYEARVTARSRLAPTEQAVCEFVLDVEPVSVARTTVAPLTRSGHRKSRFAVSVDNLGNTDLDVSLHASDPERALRLVFTPAKVSVAPAASAHLTMSVHAPRRVFGSELQRPISITGTATPVSTAAAPPVELEARATYVQRPRVARGVVTALVLAAVVALWAGIFVFGLQAVLSQQALDKSAPLSFFAPVQAAAGSAAAGASGASAGGARTGGAPAGFQPKNVAPAGIGGTITGNVSSLYEPNGVGRVTAQAYLIGSRTSVPISAATGPTGDFQIAGLFPGTYKVAFTAPGFDTVWYPGTASAAKAAVVPVQASGTTKLGGLQVTGLPGSVTGLVVTGGATVPPVKVMALVDNVPTGKTATTDAQGHYRLNGLASPATYTLSFSAPGFQQSDQQVFVNGGQAVVANTVYMSAGNGQIDGMVSDGKGPLGGVNVLATSNGRTFESSTASAGAAGQFSLSQLPTPATYLLQFSKQGYGSQSVAVELAPGQVITALRVSMVGGTGTVSGLVTGPGGAPLGGVTVTVGALATPASTQTLTGGSLGAQVGTYTIAGLPTPGTYSLTFSLSGYTSQTVGATLGPTGLAAGVDVQLQPALGQVQGRVVDAVSGRALAGVTVSITDGTNQQQTLSASSPPGGYKLTQLPAGVYTVSFSYPGYQNETALVHLAAGQTVASRIRMAPVPGAAGPGGPTAGAGSPTTAAAGPPAASSLRKPGSRRVTPRFVRGREVIR